MRPDFPRPSALATIGLPLTGYDVPLVVNAAPDRKMQISELGRGEQDERLLRQVQDLVSS